jgi:hypothetical protein
MEGNMNTPRDYGTSNALPRRSLGLALCLASAAPTEAGPTQLKADFDLPVDSREYATLRQILVEEITAKTAP